MTVKKILFIGLSSIGDVVMTTPVLQSLHKLYPEALFDIVTDKRSIGLYASYPFKGRLYLKDKSKPLRGVPDLLLKMKNYWALLHHSTRISLYRTRRSGYLTQTGNMRLIKSPFLRTKINCWLCPLETRINLSKLYQLKDL